MKNVLLDFANEQVSKIKQDRGFEVPDFNAGDTISVKYKITEGATTRIQTFKGVVLARTKSDSNYNATFTVRKISSGVGVERKFPLYSPLLAGIEVDKKGVVRRAKIYYLRSLTGKASRIKEKLDFTPRKKNVAAKSPAKATPVADSSPSKESNDESKS
jgi:large subunit ribosomal protein L19